MAQMYASRVLEVVLANQKPIKLQDLLCQLEVPDQHKDALHAYIEKSPVLVRTPRGDVKHLWQSGLQAFENAAVDAICLKTWLAANPQVNPAAFHQHVLDHCNLVMFGKGVVRKNSKLNAIDKTTLLRAICSRHVGGVSRCEAVAEYADAYRDVYELLQAGIISGSFDRLWRTV